MLTPVEPYKFVHPKDKDDDEDIKDILLVHVGKNLGDLRHGELRGI